MSIYSVTLGENAHKHAKVSNKRPLHVQIIPANQNLKLHTEFHTDVSETRTVMSCTLLFKSCLPGGANQKKTELKGEKLKRLISESGQSEALHRGPA